MGTVAGGIAAPPAPPAPSLSRERPAPPLRVRAPRAAPPEPPPLDDGADDVLELTDAAPAPEAESAPEAPSRRTRLRLTPTATDEEFTQLFEQAGGRAPEPAPDKAETEAWTWKDLLTSIDEDGDQVDGRSLDELLAAEIHELGIDPAALLPRTRIEEIAEAIEDGDSDAARVLVRRLAPAATRRLSRRLFSDDTLRRRTMTYLGRYQGLLADAQERGDTRISSLLGAEAGRVYLLLEAAAGDLV
jgi:hypothetical protein